MNPFMMMLLASALPEAASLITDAGRRDLREDDDPFPPCPDDAPFMMEVPAAAGKSSHMLSDFQDAWAKHERERLARLDAAARAEEERVASAKAAAQAKRERKGAARWRARGGSVVSLGDGAYRVTVATLSGHRDGYGETTRQLSQAGGDPSSPPEPPDDNR